MLTLAVEAAVPTAVLLAPALEGMRGMTVTALTSIDDESAATESARPSASSPFSDPIMIGLAITVALFLLSWRFGGGKKPD